MKAIFENIYGVTEESINAPFIVDGVPMGIITEANEQTFTILIWDRFIGVESKYKTSVVNEIVVKDIKKSVVAIYLNKDIKS